jgi:predicted ATPase/transcriptional regulator with XRE-family HTH domain
MRLPTCDNPPCELGQRVRRCRIASRLSQQELARRVRVSQPRISQIEAGHAVGPLPLRMLCDLADGLGVDLDTLIAGDPVYDEVDLAEVHFQSPSLANVPSPSGALIGRATDLAAVLDMMRANARLLTLVGPGGVGKTQLAIHVCAELVDDFPQGKFFVSLAACADPGSVVATIPRGVGLRERDARPLRDRLMSDLTAGRVLLVLDNVEQAVSPVSALIAELLAAYPDLRLLVTSRVPLNIRDERRYGVLPLGVPDEAQTISIATAAASPAVNLFIQRAREVVSDFVLTETNAPVIAAICRRLDGLPLAIELAATRIRVYSPAQLLRQLDRRLAFLTTGPRDMPARQRSLRASIEWSVDLLDAEQQAVLRRVAVFVGGFTLEAAEEVADAGIARSSGEMLQRPRADLRPWSIADPISTLVEHHLLTRIEQGDEAPRFGMLETIHEYAREQLEAAGETSELHGQHLAWCLSLAEQALPKMFTREEPEWVSRLQREGANIQSSLAWAFRQDQETHFESGLRLAGALADYWYVSGQLSEGRAWLTEAVTLSINRAPSIGQVRSLVGLCLMEQVQAAEAPAQAHGEQGLMLARLLVDGPGVGRALLLLGNLAMMRVKLDHARALHEEALAYFERLGDQPSIAVSHINIGMDFYRQGDIARAVACADRALLVARGIGDLWDTMVALRLKADAVRERGDLDQAGALYTESLALGWRHGSDREIADSLSGIGAAAAASADLERAARCLGAAESLYRKLEIAIPPPLRPDWPVAVARIGAGLDAKQFARAWATSPEQAFAEVVGAGQTGA